MSRRGQLNAAELEFRLAPKESSWFQPTEGLRVEKVTKRFWWPHRYARRRMRLYVTLVVGHHYFDARGARVYMPWERQ